MSLLSATKRAVETNFAQGRASPGAGRAGKCLHRYGKNPGQIKNIFGSLERFYKSYLVRDAATAASSAGTSGQRDMAINREEMPEVTKMCVSLPESVETRSTWHLLSSRGKENPARSSNSVPASLGTCIPKLLHVQLGTRFGVWGQDLDVLGSRKGMQQLPAPPPHPQGPTRGPSRQFTPGGVPRGPGEDEEDALRKVPPAQPQ